MIIYNFLYQTKSKTFNIQPTKQEQSRREPTKNKFTTQKRKIQTIEYEKAKRILTQNILYSSKVTI